MGRSNAAASDMVVEPATLLKKQNRCFGQASPIGAATTGWQYQRPRLTVRVDRWVQLRGWIGPRAIHDYFYVHEQTINTWVHSSVVRAADCRSAGPWLKSGCALCKNLCHEPLMSQSLRIVHQRCNFVFESNVCGASWEGPMLLPQTWL